MEDAAKEEATKKAKETTPDQKTADVEDEEKVELHSFGGVNLISIAHLKAFLLSQVGFIFSYIYSLFPYSN